MPDLVNLVTRVCNGGKGIFTRQKIPANSRILEFTGDRVIRDTVIQTLADGGPDSFLQIGKNFFIGSSGRADDYINHSCDPNCGLEFHGDRIYLKSIKPIKRGDELTFDYATSQQCFPFRFTCRCGSVECRGEIGDFDELPAPRKAFYLSMGVVAPYLIQPAMVRKKGVRAKPVSPRKNGFSLRPAFAPER